MSVGEAVDGQGPWPTVHRTRPAVVLLDVQLPDLDGFEVTRQLLAPPEPPVVVLVSTREASDYGRRIHGSAALGFITNHGYRGYAACPCSRKPPDPMLKVITEANPWQPK